jgi:hypothetical protein
MGDPMGDQSKSIPPVNMGDSTGLFFYRGYEYEILISGGYLLVAISKTMEGLVALLGVDIEPARLVMARYCNEPARLGSLY